MSVKEIGFAHYMQKWMFSYSHRITMAEIPVLLTHRWFASFKQVSLHCPPAAPTCHCISAVFYLYLAVSLLYFWVFLMLLFHRLQQMDEENSELRSCVPCLRANIERLEEVKMTMTHLLCIYWTIANFTTSSCPNTTFVFTLFKGKDEASG